jgi:hypothetical protein
MIPVPFRFRGCGQALRGWFQHPRGPLAFTAEKRLKTAQVNLRMDPKLKTLADKAASDDQRSLTSLIEKLLADYLRQHGYLKK